MKKLPIGSQTFSELIEDQHYYVDKTPLIAELAATGKYYFLANPRRFGKSLLISTLKSAFSGEQALFNGLYLQDHWDWLVRYPVIHISLGAAWLRPTRCWANGFGPCWMRSPNAMR